MTITSAYFNNSGIFNGTAIDNPQSLVKKAIVAIEGTHFCNRGKKHDFPAARIQRMAENTNQEILNGRTISLFINHDKTHDATFGNLMGLVECRKVTESDLPNPDARGMLGKLAIFATANIVKHADRVQQGLIKALSPGIDTARDIIFEVSAVPVAAMPGVALFSYAEVKEQRTKYREMRDRAIECLDTFVESLRMGERLEEGSVSNDVQQRSDWFGDFVADLRTIFDLPTVEEGEEIAYSNNPYDRQVIKGFSAQFASPDVELTVDQKDKVLTEAADIIEESTEEDAIAHNKKTLKDRANAKVASLIRQRGRR